MLEKLIDDLDDLARSRINQYSVIIHVRISVTLDVVLSRNFIIRHAVGRQDRANSEVAVVVRRMVLMRDIFMKPRARIDPENATNCSRDRTHRAPDDCAYGTCVSVAYGSALFCTPNGALGLRSQRRRYRCQ